MGRRCDEIIAQSRTSGESFEDSTRRFPLQDQGGLTRVQKGPSREFSEGWQLGAEQLQSGPCEEWNSALLQEVRWRKLAAILHLFKSRKHDKPTLQPS